jgi:hypothetical protein
MLESTPMTITERYQYLGRMSPRYHRADRATRGHLLDEMAVMTGLHRKSLLRLLAPGGLTRERRTRERGCVYDTPVDDVMRVVWETLDFVCAERLTPALLSTARLLAAHGELVLAPAVEAPLGRISISTVQRRLGRFGQDTPRLPRRGPARASRLTREIPTRRIPWDEPEPGHFEVDRVHHSGPSTAGEYVHTLQMVDVATGWSERGAVLGRSYRHMEAGFRQILTRQPFPVREVHPDNGPEVLNDHLVRFWQDAARGLTLSRSRPYQKNDNRFVEQKNHSLVRAYFGNARFDTPTQCAALNALYEQLWVYYNCFQPVLRLREKTWTALRARRKWDTAQPPLARLLATDALSAPARTALETRYQTTNPRTLRRAIQAQLEALLHLPGEAAQEPAA